MAPPFSEEFRSAWNDQVTKRTIVLVVAAVLAYGIWAWRNVRLAELTSRPLTVTVATGSTFGTYECRITP